MIQGELTSTSKAKRRKPASETTRHPHSPPNGEDRCGAIVDPVYRQSLPCWLRRRAVTANGTWTVVWLLVAACCVSVAIFTAAGGPADHGDDRAGAGAAAAAATRRSGRRASSPMPEMRTMSSEHGDTVPSPDDTNNDHQSSPPSPGPAVFCRGMPMLMNMDGFHFSLSGNGKQCLTYFVESWQLTDAGKFRGAMVFSFLLAVLIEALSAGRGVISRSFQPGSSTQHALFTAMYGLQGVLGYCIMFLTMSYSVELILSVVFGLMVGNRLFMRTDEFEGLRGQAAAAAAAAAARRQRQDQLQSTERQALLQPQEHQTTGDNPPAANTVFAAASTPVSFGSTNVAAPPLRVPSSSS